MGFFRRSGALVGPGGEGRSRDFRGADPLGAPQAVAKHERLHLGLELNHLQRRTACVGHERPVFGVDPGIRPGLRGGVLAEGLDAGVEFPDERLALLGQGGGGGKRREGGFEEGAFRFEQPPDARAEIEVVPQSLEVSVHEVGEASARGDGAGGGTSTAPWLSSCHCVVARERHWR